jgi:hypothetical protein
VLYELELALYRYVRYLRSVLYGYLVPLVMRIPVLYAVPVQVQYFCLCGINVSYRYNKPVLCIISVLYNHNPFVVCPVLRSSQYLCCWVPVALRPAPIPLLC